MVERLGDTFSFNFAEVSV